MKTTLIKAMAWCAVASLPAALMAQNRRDSAAAPRSMQMPPRPGGMGAPGSSGPKPYNEVITAKAKTDAGLFKVHKVEDRFFFEIADSLLGRDILVVNRIGKAAAGSRSFMMGYAGDQI